jgi:hypothetical protein
MKIGSIKETITLNTKLPMAGKEKIQSYPSLVIMGALRGMTIS